MDTIEESIEDSVKDTVEESVMDSIEEDAAATDASLVAHGITALKLYLAFSNFKGTMLMANEWGNSTSMMATKARKLLVFNAVAGAMVAAYKFTTKLIAPLYLLQAISHYGFLLAFLVLTTSNDNEAIRTKSAPVVEKIKKLHFAYALVIVLGFLRLSKCTEEEPYPSCFVLGDVLFYLTYALCSKFGMEQVKQCLDEDGNNKELCIAQFEAFFAKYKMMAAWHGLELLLGKVLFKTKFEGALICGGDGTEWHYRENKGKLFLILHILGTMQALGAHGAIFVKTVTGEKAVGKLDSKNKSD